YRRGRVREGGPGLPRPHVHRDGPGAALGLGSGRNEGGARGTGPAARTVRGAGVLPCAGAAPAPIRLTPALPASTGVLATIALVKRRGPQRLLFAALATALCTHPGVAAVLPEALPDGYPREDLDVLRGSAVERYIREIEAEKGALTEPERKVDHEIRRVLQPPPSFGPRLQEPAPGLQLALSIRLRSAEPQEVEELVRRGFELERTGPGADAGGGPGAPRRRLPAGGTSVRCCA